MVTEEKMFNLKDCLKELGLTQKEAAKLLSVNIRTMNRWVREEQQITGPAKQTFIAWLRLKRHNLAWGPWVDLRPWWDSIGKKVQSEER